MAVLTVPLAILAAILTPILRIGRFLAWVALGLMVVVILAQVFFRYVVGDALNWPDEAARFLMLWMTGLIAPSAYRWGGFVAIDMVPELLPRIVKAVLMLILLAIALLVLTYAVSFGWNHTMGFGGNFDSSSLRVPLDLVGGESVKVKLRYMYGSLLLGCALLWLVTIELILRNIIELIDPTRAQPSRDEPGGVDAVAVGAD